MTCFAGGKKRIGKRIYERIRELEDTFVAHRKYFCPPSGQRSQSEQDEDNKDLLPYLEPMMGMLGVGQHFAAEQLAREDRQVHLCDANQDLIAMWQSVQEGSWFPPSTCTRQYYDYLKESFRWDLKADKKTRADRIFIGCVASYGGNCFSGGYRLDYAAKAHRDYLQEAARSVEKIRPLLIHATIHDARDYGAWDPRDSLVYCDPPYKDNKLGPKSFRTFDHQRFWDTMRAWSEEARGNLVLISERVAPDDFVPVWTARSTLTVSRTGYENTEHLFTHKSIWDKLAVFLD